MAKAKPCSRLKLLIDMKKDRVLFAEAGKDFVENMCMILRSGCVHHLCKGVGLLSEFSILESEAAETYIITDDLIFTPMSTLVLLKIFQKFEISDMDSLSEITATVSDSQMNKLAIVSLRSKTVLTDVLLPSQAQHTKRKEENSIQKQDDDNEEEGDKQKEDPIESAMRVKPSRSRLLFFQKRKEENSIQKQDDDNEEEGDKQKEDPIESAMRVKPSKRTKPVGGQSNIIFSEETVTLTTKKIHSQKFAELIGNDIFKGDAPPGSDEKPLSVAKLSEMSGSNIFADGKPASREYLGGVRKPSVGESRVSLV